MITILGEIMKKTLRKEMIQKRRALTDGAWHKKSQNILSHIQESMIIEDAENIMIFMDFRKEVETRPIIEWLWAQNKNVIIPRVKKGSPILELCLIESFEEMNLSALGILEPKATHSEFVTPESIEFVFMPGVAFTRDGCRLGYGGGYYDQLIPLMQNHIPRIALAFDLQIVENLPTEDHDIKIDGIITENGVIHC